MTVYRKNISINVGETFSEDLTLLGSDGNGVVDLTGFTAQSQLRKHPSNPRFADIQVGIVNATQGLINISIADTITSNIKPGRHVYDVMLTRPSGSKIIGVEGSVLVRSGISTGCF